MDGKLRLTQRELTEIHHALWYKSFANHGTVGHNMLIIIAKLAEVQGFGMTDGGLFIVPENLTIVEEKR